MILSGVKRIAVGVSGGVDSAVSAHLLQKQGFDVIGVYMKNWDISDEDFHEISCTSDSDASSAQSICSRLKIPFITVNFVKEYWTLVFQELISDYLKGWTPNPDVLCNQKIKFNYFSKYCLSQLNCDYVATGHYARKTSEARLLVAKDGRKDQTLFLSQISQEALKSTLFPIGNYNKTTVKEIARSIGLEDVAKRKESMGMCFIGKKRYGFQNFIQNYIPNHPGDLIDIDTGSIVGSHNGIHQWTIGQRVRLGGKSMKQFVVQKDPINNYLVICNGNDHPSLFSRSFITGPPHWIYRAPENLENGKIELEFRFQNTAPLTKCWISYDEEKVGEKVPSLKVETFEVLRAITPGQFAVFYHNGECLGSSVIHHVYSYI